MNATSKKEPAAAESMDSLAKGTRFLGQDNTGREKGLYEMEFLERSDRHVKLAMFKGSGSKTVKWFDRAQWAIVEILQVPPEPAAAAGEKS